MRDAEVRRALLPWACAVCWWVRTVLESIPDFPVAFVDHLGDHPHPRRQSQGSGA
ncbi:hypothetical protein [Streptoalloteichus tenebrarius]|uniref:hypothetical protein n=1 Tax=Streptoalloteichus tenebrarius (strain ATCC 17920 / DSM 40477 / JCM 4838 / CBS 697.72 / NBRC 16177 / NCIMB 11028 / NRRL B-12390 / A12253. 1 / ISP 5477) TaxID=1933 RepID=UPI0020A26FB0|nr:hypothetical protein [Streptoalloteichus tenebrarius]BFE98447.1 hypothetical protein GCM10020241_01230 [Streptoalloteichus tenebrarius]